MRKTPAIIAGLAIVGAAYLGTLYVSGNKAMARLHQWVDDANAYQSKVHIDLQDEKKGLFTSTATIVIADAQGKVNIDAPLSLHHGLFSTDIDSRVAFVVNGQNVMTLAQASDDRFLVQAHVKHNDDGRGSEMRVSTQGVLVLSGRDGDELRVEQPDLSICRANDGSLIIRIHEAAYQSFQQTMVVAAVDVTNSIVYDNAWVERAISIIKDSLKRDSEENAKSIAVLMLSQIPDIRSQIKKLNIKDGQLGINLNDAKLAWISEQDTTPVYHLTASVQDVIAVNKHYKGAISLKVDRRVSDLFMGAVRSVGESSGHFNQAEYERKLVALLQESPRLTLESFSLSGDDLPSVTADGYVSVGNANIKSIDDANKQFPDLLAGQLEVRNVPAQALGLAAYAGLYNLKAGDDVKFEISKGHLIANGTLLF